MTAETGGAEPALLAAAIASYDADGELARARFYCSAARGRPEVPHTVGRSIELCFLGAVHVFHVSRLDARCYRVATVGLELPVELTVECGGRRLVCGERSWQALVTPQGAGLRIEIDGVPFQVERDQGGVVSSPAPAIVAALRVEEGSQVAVGDPLAVLEAMKMETTLRSPLAGRVRKVLVRKHEQVGIGKALLIIEPAVGILPLPAGPAQRADFRAFAAAIGTPPKTDTLGEIRRLLLGWDVDAKAIQRALAQEPLSGADAASVEQALCTWADLCSLFRRQGAAGGEEDGRHSSEEYLFTYLRDLDAHGAGLPAAFLDKLRRALACYGVVGLDRTPELEESLLRIAVSHDRLAQQAPPVLALLERLLAGGAQSEGLRQLLDRVIAETRGRENAVHDLAREVRYRRFDRPLVLAEREAASARAEEDLARLGDPAGEAEAIDRLVACALPLHHRLSQRFASAALPIRQALLEVMVRRYYRIRRLEDVARSEVQGQSVVTARYDYRGERFGLLATHCDMDGVGALDRLANEHTSVIDLYVSSPRQAEDLDDEDAAAQALLELVARQTLPAGLKRVAVAVSGPRRVAHYTYRRSADSGALAEDRVARGLHPMMAQRLELWRLANFDLESLEAPEGVYLFRGVARENPQDERLFALAEVRDLTPVRDASGRLVELPQLEHLLMEALAGIRRFQSRRAADRRLLWNRVLLYLWPPVALSADELTGIVHRLAPMTEGLGLEKVAVRGRLQDPATGAIDDWVLDISNPDQTGMVLRLRKPKDEPLKPLREYARKVVELRRRGLTYPYEIVKWLAPSHKEGEETAAALAAGAFTEHDLDARGRLLPVDRPYGENTANVVVGVIRNTTGRYPEGMARVILLGDPSRGMGALAEPECRRILAALDLAERLGVPLEWFALSAGARIAMDSGTENMDWIARVLRRLVRFTQAGGEVNLVVPGINVGAQPYWNAEATMLMHTRGILIMTPEGALVLTGKQALDYSGGVSAEDNQGIGGYERIMGPNGQAQYFAPDLNAACRILLAYYEHTYRAPGELFPRPAPTRDPRDRNVCDFPHGGELATVGEVFSDATNPGRKKPFEIRRVMAAVVDQDHPPLERWYGMRDAEIAVVWDAHLGGHPVCLLGFESKPIPRLGFVPVNGPDQWTGGTLFPLGSKKVARAINAASGNRPLVVLANLSGFDGSPESMRNWQLEYGAEIGRAVVNFRGPIVFCVVSRYHGGAFVVFSAALHDNLEVAALTGTYASVIGGAPAAAVVFAREVDKRTADDPRVAELEAQLADPARLDKAALRARLEEAREAVRAEKLGQVADEFDAVHSVERALRVGSIHRIIPPQRLRPYLIDAVERGMAKELAGAEPLVLHTMETA